ncbi:hypothetical protein ACFSCZ_05035 [Siminovitchia sediminis]|uniref:Tetratricopeptide repeat protein n=1 Tax=Siminovitchia sediminis TaxID=1274353 RepID=A0ABW4KIV0_9BACI
MKKCVILILTGFILAGCGNSTYDKAMEQGKLALTNEEYEEAIAFFELALEEKPKDEEAKTAYEDLSALQQIEEQAKDSQWDEVIDKAEDLLNKDGVSSSIQKKLEEYISTAKAHKEQHQLVSKEVKKIKEFIEKESYTDAYEMIRTLQDNHEVQEVLPVFSEDIHKMKTDIDEGMLKQKAEKEAEEMRIAEAEEKRKSEAAAAKQKRETAWTTYTNPRFGFQVKYPQGWTLGPEPTNGDGRALYQGDGGEIIASAYNLMPETRPDLTNYETLQTHHGETAYLRVQNDGSSVHFHGCILNDEIVFSLTGFMDAGFYEEYSDVLEQMLLSARSY